MICHQIPSKVGENIYGAVPTQKQRFSCHCGLHSIYFEVLYWQKSAKVKAHFARHGIPDLVIRFGFFIYDGECEKGV